MIILHSEFPGLVGVWSGGFEMGVTNQGAWYLGPADYVQCSGASWTNNQAGFILLQVDAGGHMAVTEADVLGMAELGFTAAFASVGLILFIRWLARTFLGAAKIRTNYD